MMLDNKTQEIVKLMDEAILLADKRLKAKRSGRFDATSTEDLEQILSGLRYRRNEAITSGWRLSGNYETLGLARAILEVDVPDSELVHKIGEIERYFLKHFVKK